MAKKDRPLKKLNRKHKRAAQMLAFGNTPKSVATAKGIEVRQETISRWKADPLFAAEVKRIEEAQDAETLKLARRASHQATRNLNIALSKLPGDAIVKDDDDQHGIERPAFTIDNWLRAVRMGVNLFKPEAELPGHAETANAVKDFMAELASEETDHGETESEAESESPQGSERNGRSGR